MMKVLGLAAPLGGVGEFGSDAADMLGTGGDDHITGGDGDDVIRGRAGDDVLAGGAGNDAIYGGLGDDTLEGGSGNDTLYGGSGTNEISGGSGDDLVYYKSTLDVLSGGSGNDTLSLALFSHGLDFELAPAQGLGFENLIGTGFDDRLDGSHRAELIDGGAGDDFIDGEDSTRFASDTLLGGEGKDTIFGGRHADMLDGGAGDDLLLARWGADTVSGGEGADRLSLSLEGSEATGGAGADHFNYFAPQAHGVLGEALITDLEDQDVIDLHRLDADSTTGGDQAFTLVGSLTGTAGEATLSYDAGSDQTSLLLDTDGDGSADITILMDGDHSSFSNFVL